MRDFEQEPNENFGGPEDELPKEPSQAEPSEPQPADSVQETKSEEEQKAPETYPVYQNHTDFGTNGNKPPKKGASASLLVAFCLVLFIFIAISVGAIFDVSNDGSQITTSNSTSQSTSSSSSFSSSEQEQSTSSQETAPGASVVTPGTDEYVSIYREIANKCIKSVVVIQVTSTSGAGAGSGVIYDPNGYIITNYHVANETCKTISVQLYDGSTYDGQYIYGDELADLAVIKIEKANCDYAVFGDSSGLTYGDAVLAIGNPLGYGLSVTSGVISRPSESVTMGNATMTLLRTDAAVNSGNSGGGLFDLNGKLIGIVNAKIAANTVDNVGYAIPSATVVKCINDLKNYGYITGRARLGVTVQEQIIQSFWNSYALIQVTEIDPDGSAAGSGLQAGDILYKCNGVEVASFATLSQQLTKYSIGDTITLTVLRPTIELTQTNLTEYLNTAEQKDIQITFREFNPNT